MTGGVEQVQWEKEMTLSHAKANYAKLWNKDFEEAVLVAHYEGFRKNRCRPELH